jgi:hypothetical protein
MSYEWAYIPGNEWMICDSCGGKFRKSDMRLRWDNLWTCKKDFELRHPQDFVQARTDKVAKDNPRPRPTDIFVGPACSTNKSTPGIAVPGCLIPGY